MKPGQKTINIVGSIVVGLSMLAIGGSIKMIFDLKATVNKADVNTKSIDKNSKVLHGRITSNHEKIEEIYELSIRADERSRLNREDIRCLK